MNSNKHFKGKFSLDFDMILHSTIAVDAEGTAFVWGQNMNYILEFDTDCEAIMTPSVLYSLK